MLVISKNPLGADDYRRIEQIFRESQCPNESLRATFPKRFSKLLGDIVTFDGATLRDFNFDEEIDYDYS